MLSPDATRTSTPNDPGDLTRSVPDLATHSAVDPQATADGPVVAAFGEVPVVPGFEIMEEVGRGGMGIVFKARHIKLNRIVALKMILNADPRSTIRFLAEAEAAAAVRHPHVVQVFDFGEVDGRPFLAMEYLGGGDLSERRKAAQRFTPHDAAALVGKIAHGVAAAHSLGIVHRDIKPGNVLFDSSGSPKVVDFGLAKRGGSSDLTHTHAIMGTPAYMAPEQAKGAKFAGPPADVWALGVILYECLTGSRPFDGDDVQVILNAVLNSEPESLRSRNITVPRDLNLIVLKCLAKEPHERYATAAELAEELDRFGRGEPVLVRPAGIVERTLKWARRKPALAGLYAAGLVAVVLLTFSVAIGVLWRDAVEARRQAEGERENAVSARDAETTARTRAEESGKQVETARKELAALNVVRTISLAQREFRSGNLDRARELLETCPPEHRNWEWRHVHRTCHAELLTLPGGMANQPTMTPNGVRVATYSQDRRVRIWDVHTGAEVRAIDGNSATFSPDGSRLVSNASDNVVRVWDIVTGNEVSRFQYPGKFVGGNWFSPDGTRIVTTGGDKNAYLWEADSGRQLAELKGHATNVYSAAFNHDGTRVATYGGELNQRGIWEYGTRVWDARTGEQLVYIHCPQTMDHTGAQFTPDGESILTTGEHYTLRLCDATTGAEVRVFRGHTGWIWSSVLSKDGTRLLTASMDATARIWDTATGKELVALRGHESDVASASFSPDETRVVTAGRDGTARVWDAKEGTELVLHRCHNGRVFAAVFTPDGSRLVTRGINETRVWNAAVGSEGAIIRVPSGSTMAPSAGINPDGDRVATAGGYGQSGVKNGIPYFGGWPVQVWDGGSGVELLSTNSTSAGEHHVAFSPDGSRMAVADRLSSTAVWDVATGKKLVTLKGAKSSHLVWSVWFSPEGSRLATASSDSLARIWDANTGEELQVFKGHTGEVRCAAYSPDGTRLVTASKDGTARIWDVASGDTVVTLKGPGGELEWAEFSPDGSRVVTAGGLGQTARIWDARTGAELLVIQGHYSTMNTATFSPDGTRILTGSMDRTARLWDANSGAELLVLSHTRELKSAAFSRDGSRVLTVCWGGEVRVWDTRPPVAPPIGPPLSPPKRLDVAPLPRLKP